MWQQWPVWESVPGVGGRHGPGHWLLRRGSEAGCRLARRLPASGTVSPRWPSAMDFQPPYFPPPFPGAQGPNPTGDVFSQHLATDPYQQYAVSCPEQKPRAFKGSHSCCCKENSTCQISIDQRKHLSIPPTLVLKTSKYFPSWELTLCLLRQACRAVGSATRMTACGGMRTPGSSSRRPPSSTSTGAGRP